MRKTLEQLQTEYHNRIIGEQNEKAIEIKNELNKNYILQMNLAEDAPYKIKNNLLESEKFLLSQWSLTQKVILAQEFKIGALQEGWGQNERIQNVMR